jgi:hypothetical protein
MILWEVRPREELLPALDSSVLEPEGWERRFDRDTKRPFYVDRFARAGEQRCFWQPPSEEKGVEDIPGWERVCNLFGRIYWINRSKSQDRSYIHPINFLLHSHASTISRLQSEASCWI